MRIIICDDEKFFLDQIQSHVCKFLAQNRILAEIICYTTSNEVISNIKVPTDLFLLDVKLPGNSGLELASIIRNVQPDACIIFISSITDAVFTSFMYSPLRFIRKDHSIFLCRIVIFIVFHIIRPTKVTNIIR